tara:strand:+ start:7554 stop:8744 length:1191 start_codon:yes stop_codon:yes gene_type:complete
VPDDTVRTRQDSPQVIVRPMAGPARRRKRHVGLLASILVIVGLPLAVIAWYAFARAVDQYASDLGFTVRQEEQGQTQALLGNLAQLAGPSASGGALDGDILNEFIQSQGLVREVDARLDLWAHYSAPYETDPVFALKPGGTIEDLVAYWQRVVTIDYDQATGLIGVEVRAFAPEYAQAVAQAVLEESQTLVNNLNAAARQDLQDAAERDVAQALVRLKDAREALVGFRTRTQIVDPETDLETRMGVQNSLQQQLAQALVEYDLLAQSAGETAPSVIQAERRIAVIRDRLAQEREAFASDQSYAGVEGYPSLIAQYESLTVDREYAEETYRAALAQLDAAKAGASRQTRYLAAYVLPTQPEAPAYPQRTQIVLMALLFLSLGWALVALVYYSIRDRR